MDLSESETWSFHEQEVTVKPVAYKQLQGNLEHPANQKTREVLKLKEKNGHTIYRVGLLGGVRPYVFFVKMKVKIIFDLHTHDFFLGENGKNRLGPIPNLSLSSYMHSITEPAFRCTFGSKFSEDVTFSH